MGRAPVLAALDGAIDDALAGRGGGAVVVGEAGIGKTRLVNEVVARRRDAGATVAWASASEPGATPAYWHWIQLLRSLALALDRRELVDDLGPDAAELARLVPGLRSGVDLAGAPAPEGDDPRFRLFDAVASFLRRTARRRPVLVVLDDLHSADVASLQLLRFVLGNLRLDPVAVVATARDRESEPLGDGISALLHEIERNATSLRLGGLDSAAVELLLAQHIDGALAARFASTIHRRSGGNPLFVSELARLLATDPAAAEVPATIRALIERRISPLPPAAVEVLRVAAVAGDEFDVDLVAAAAGSSRDGVLDAVGAGLRAHLVAEARPGSFRFSHALIREVLEQQLDVRRRALVHRALADQLERVPGDPPLAELARHHLAATVAIDDGRAATSARRAAARATEQLAYEDAATLLRSALTTRVDGADRIALLLDLGAAELRAGNVGSARDAFLDAAAGARREGRADLLARAALGLGSGLDGFEIRLFDHAQITLLDEALDALPPAPSGLRARATARLSVALTFSDSDARRRQLADDAIAMARTVGDDLALAYALAARCDATAGPHFVDDRLAASTEIVRIATAASDLGLELLGRRNRLVALLERGDIPAVDAEIERYGASARAIGQPLYQWYEPLWRGMRALMDGRIPDARAHGERAAAVGARAASHNASLNAAVLAWNISRKEGSWADAAAGLGAQLALADGIYGEPFWIAIVTPHLHRAEAAAALDRLAARQFDELPRDAVWLAAMTYAAESCGVVGHRQAAEALYDLIEPHRTRFAVDAIGAACYGSMARPLGIVAAVLGRRQEALDQLDAALAVHRASGASALVAETLHDLGVALWAFGEERRAAAVVSEAARLYRSIGMGRAAELAAEGGPAEAAAERPDVFRMVGDHWQLAFAGRAVVVADAKGLHDIATLLERPGREVHVADLIARTDPGDPAVRDAVLRGAPGGAVLDDRARAAYRRTLVELRHDLDDAEANGDSGRAEAARTAMDLVASELAMALGMGGRSRTHADASERARKAVTQRIRNSIKRLATVHPELAAHLDRSVRTGRFCVYDPPAPVSWSR